MKEPTHVIIDDPVADEQEAELRQAFEAAKTARPRSTPGAFGDQAKAERELRKSRDRYRFIFSHPGFRGHRKFIGYPFRLRPAAPLKFEEIESPDGTKVKRAIHQASSSVYAPHQGERECARRQRYNSSESALFADVEVRNGGLFIRGRSGFIRLAKRPTFL